MSIENAQHSVFISYAREDHDWVTAAVNLLIAGGAKIFMDVRDIAYGEKWEEVLRSKLREAERVMVFWSRHAAVSQWVKEEWEVALENGKRLVPVPIDDTPLPDGLSQFQALTSLKPLLQPSLDSYERPKLDGKASSLGRFGIIAASAGVLLSLSVVWFLTPGSVDQSPQSEKTPPDGPVDLLPPVQPTLPPESGASLFDTAPLHVVLGAFIVVSSLIWVAVRWIRKRSRSRELVHPPKHRISPDLDKSIITPSLDAALGKRVVDMVFDESNPGGTH